MANLFTYLKDKDDWTVFNDGPIIVSCAVLIKDETLYVMFEGTTEPTDWLSDFNFIPRIKKYNMVLHSGFYHQYEIVKDYIVDQVSKLYKEGMRVVVTGWSLGGALSQICVQDLNHHFNVKPILITFGSPKASVNRATRKLIESCIDTENSHEYLNRNDVVTIAPPGYWHIKTDWYKIFNFFGYFNPMKNHFVYEDIDTSAVWK